MINRDSVITDFLNGQTPNEFISLLVWAGIGFILSTLLELLRHSGKIQVTGGFSISFWLKDNLIRFIISIITILIGVSFTKEVTGLEVGNYGSLIAGFITDKIVEGLIKFKSNVSLTNILNVFIKKS